MRLSEKAHHNQRSMMNAAKNALTQYTADNPFEKIDAEDFEAGFALGAAHTPNLASPDAERSRMPDPDTYRDGVKGPFKYWESDSTGLVHVLWSAKHNDLTLVNNADEISTRIMHSRWLAAARAEARAGKPMTTIEDLIRFVDDGGLVRDANSVIFQRDGNGSDKQWWKVGSDVKHPISAIALPAHAL
jgi:hypothetical protein